jgi:hypothetical protein
MEHEDHLFHGWIEKCFVEEDMGSSYVTSGVGKTTLD